jgi:hypothetical protein
MLIGQSTPIRKNQTISAFSFPQLPHHFRNRLDSVNQNPLENVFGTHMH